MSKFLFTSESVTEGHPDKVCDQISDAVLDAMLAQDNKSRVACETFASTGIVTIMGEITTTAEVDIEKIAREVVCSIGYDSEDAYFDGHTCRVNVMLDKQSPDIAMGVDKSLELKDGENDELNLFGAGDQGMMFGYACNETTELMPMTAALAHKMALRLTEVRKSGELSYLRPDGKTQVTIEYVDGKPVRLDTVVVSSQHSADISLEQLRLDILRNFIIDVAALPSGKHATYNVTLCDYRHSAADEMLLTCVNYILILFSVNILIKTARIDYILKLG